LAQTAGVARVATRLAELGITEELPNLEALRNEFAPRAPLQPSVQVELPTLAAYDRLVGCRP
ncbi:MAG TPA: IS21 family transposase, partial [Gammaproteobacteria bacterium]